jgi:hypothetical protein
MVFKDSPTRHRLTLLKKREIVELYNLFKLNNSKQNNNQHATKTTIESFILMYSSQIKSINSGIKLNVKNVYKWTKAYERFEYMSWNKRNNVLNVNCNPKLIIDTINFTLTKQNPHYAHLYQLDRSKLVKEQYGIFAKINIDSGTELGFLSGILVANSSVNVLELKLHKFELSEEYHIDCQAYDSCYARYYVSSNDTDKQNVSVMRHAEWSGGDHSRAIYFVASRFIRQNTELVVPTDCRFMDKEVCGMQCNYSVQQSK